MGRVSDVPTATASAYAVIPMREGEITHVEGTSTTVVALDQPAPTFVKTEILEHVPEARGVTWHDDFFEEHGLFDDVVAVFDFDYDSMESHYKCLSWSCLGVTALCCQSTIPFMILALVPCKLNQNVSWNVRAQHIALTRTGILFVHDQRPACWGERCCTVGKRTKFIPYEQITEFHIADANTKTCSVHNSLNVVNVGTKDSNNKMQIGLEITGLKDPHAFQKLAMALKSSNLAGSTTSAINRLAMVMDDRGIIANASAYSSNQEVAVLLREIRDELRRNNNNNDACAQSIPPQHPDRTSPVQPYPMQPSAPPAAEEK